MRTNYNPLNYWPPNRVPYEALNHGKLDSLRANGGFDDLVEHVVAHHAARGRSVTRDQIKENLLSHTRQMGIPDAQGAGFWGDVWSGIKNAVGNVAGNAWAKFQADPLGTINKVVETVQPFLKPAEAAA